MISVLLVLAWVFSLLGAGMSFVVSLAGGMKAIPSLSVGEAALAFPLPILAILCAGAAYLMGARLEAPPSLWRVLPPIAIALLSIAFVVLVYLEQPSRR